MISILHRLSSLNLKKALINWFCCCPPLSDEIVTDSDLLKLTELAVAEPGFKSAL